MIIQDNSAARLQAAEIIRRGGVIGFRTDTFYGLGADPLNAGAVRQVKELKGSHFDKPILLLISDTSVVDRFIEQSELFKIVAGKRWPGPLTLIGVSRAAVPSELTGGTNTLGVRVPDDEDVRALVRECGGALTATSANLSGTTSARTAREVETYFAQELDLIIDGGATTTTQPSTVLDLSGTEARVIREGAISLEELEEFL